jgi:hypothetical protein
MRRTAVWFLLGVLGTAAIAAAGFKVKRVEPKKPEKFQVRQTVAGVTYAADLLLGAKDQEKFFYKELSPSNVIAVRLAVFNEGTEEVVVPLQSLRLLAPDGAEVPLVDPLVVADALTHGKVVGQGAQRNPSAVISPGMRTGDPRMDPSDPRYDPTMDPTRPTYDPNDPRNRYPNDPRYGGYGRPGVDVVLSPGGGSQVDLTVNEYALVRKDFEDKAHSMEPVLARGKRDKFLFFSLEPPPSSPRGFRLRITPGKGIPQEILLEF